MASYNKGINNPMYGHKLSLEAIQKVRDAKIGKKNPAWKGERVGHIALHQWVRRNKQKSEVCEICQIKEPFDLANVSGLYKRDFDDWMWLCRKCHQISDGRYEKLKSGIGLENLKLRWRRK